MKLTVMKAHVTWDDIDASRNAHLSKSLHRLDDGSIDTKYDPVFPNNWHMDDQREIESLDDLAAIYEEVQGDHERLFAIGWTSDDFGPRVAGTFHEEGPQMDFVPFDCDGMDYPDGYSDETLRTDPEGTARACVRHIFGEDVDALVALSSKGGLVGQFRAHVYVAVEDTVSYAAWSQATAELAAHVEEELDGKIDTSIASAGHFIFTCKPLLYGGIEAPTQRIIRVRSEGKLFIPEIRNITMRKKQGKRSKKRERDNTLLRFPVDKWPGANGRDNLTRDWIWSCVMNGFREDTFDAENQIAAAFDDAVIENGFDLHGSTISSRKVRQMYRRAIHKAPEPWDGGDSLEAGFDDEGMDADSAHKAMRDAMLSLRDEVGVFHLTATTGTGKTRAALDLIHRFVGDGWSVAYASRIFVFSSDERELLKKLPIGFPFLREGDEARALTQYHAARVSLIEKGVLQRVIEGVWMVEEGTDPDAKKAPIGTSTHREAA